MIDKFDGAYRFLSNFYCVNVVLDNMTFYSVEHAYQAAKSLIGHERRIVQQCATASEAKRIGKQLTLRADWEQVKDSVMLDLLRQKFAQEPLRNLLLATGNEELIEGNWWGDVYWGVCRGRGLNLLGILLMQVRAELRIQDELADNGHVLIITDNISDPLADEAIHEAMDVMNTELTEQAHMPAGKITVLDQIRKLAFDIINEGPNFVGDYGDPCSICEDKIAKAREILRLSEEAQQ